MNLNTAVICDTCEERINLRIGMSNRDVQPFRFGCPKCGSPIDFTIASGHDKGFMGAHETKFGGPFDDAHPFVDLHLDFPVTFGKYVMGMTPFMVAITKIGHERFALHNERLNQLNKIYKQKDEIRNLIRLYSGSDKQIFKIRVEKFLRTKLPSSQAKDINAGLYLLVSKVFEPFIHRQSVLDVVEGYPKFLFTLAQKDEAKLHQLFDHMVDTKFLRNIQLDALELYPSILDAELPLRPALYLDHDDTYQGGGLSPARVSTEKFNTYKDLYKDISEVLNRQIVIVAGLNNLYHRGDFNAFPDLGRKKKPATLSEFADVPFGAKLDWLDNCWYIFDQDSIDNKLRNAIAHFKAEYDDRTQILTYFPKLEGIEQVKAETMYFLDFMRKILHSYREVHYLHHLVKSILYYRLIVQKKTV